jgi:serine/threonine protein kinase
MEKIDLTNKVDIWAFGCSLYFMLNKKDPFDGKDPAEIKRKILNFKLS